MDVPEAWHGRCQLEVAAETAEARLMRQTVHHQAYVLLQPLARSGLPDVEAFPTSAFLATHVDEHGKPSPRGPTGVEPVLTLLRFTNDASRYFFFLLFPGFSGFGNSAGVGVAVDRANVEFAFT